MLYGSVQSIADFCALVFLSYVFAAYRHSKNRDLWADDAGTVSNAVMLVRVHTDLQDSVSLTESRNYLQYYDTLVYFGDEVRLYQQIPSGDFADILPRRSSIFGRPVGRLAKSSTLRVAIWPLSTLLF